MGISRLNLLLEVLRTSSSNLIDVGEPRSSTNFAHLVNTIYVTVSLQLEM
jgi:hypothetical protein